ncbi:Aspartate--tRNA ligase like protein [Verticillium longisporum]|nr:Aspartate--tRNA ligase like protein [Verticillium longisporum]
MITDLEKPFVDAWVFRPHEDADRKEVHEFMQSFLQNLHKSHSQNPDGAPQALMYDTSKPLEGFSALGPDGLKTLQDAASPESGLSTLENGDVVVFQARQDRPHQGGSTKLGEVRIALYHAAIEAQLLERDDSFQFLWVTDFPMFTPNEEVDVGQGGSSGFSATHHPFTAPLTVEDLELLFTDPLKAKADHYDLVLNGVELGGGSRRIHVAAMQEFIFRDILQMTKPKMAEFSHLLKALRAGCPPHAGFALGFDRFAAVLSGSSSVRGVIAFPKNNKGVDEFAGGPGKISDEQLKTYHLQLRKNALAERVGGVLNAGADVAEAVADGAAGLASSAGDGVADTAGRSAGDVTDGAGETADGVAEGGGEELGSASDAVVVAGRHFDGFGGGSG